MSLESTLCENTMWTETRRPQTLDQVVGHTEVKERLRAYLSSPP